MSRTREELNEDRVLRWYAEQRYIEAQIEAMEEGIIPYNGALYEYLHRPAPWFITRYVNKEDE